MAVLAIGVVAVLLVVLTLGSALLVEIRAVRREIAHGNKTQHRIALVEGGRYRSSKRTYGERSGRRADHEDRIRRYAKASIDKLESICDLLASFAAPERATAPTEAEEEEQTSVWTAAETARIRSEIEAGGADDHPSATARAALSVDVAPPASAPPPPVSSAALEAPPRVFLSMDVAPRAAAALAPPLSRAAQLAAGLERPKSTRGSPHSPQGLSRTETLAGMASPLPRAPSEGVAPIVAVPRFPQTLLSMQAQRAPTDEAPTRREAVAVGVRPSNAQIDATTVLDPVPPMYARHGTMRSSAPLAHPDLIGSEDIADEVTRLSLGPEEPTPPRGARAAPLLPVVQGPGEEWRA